MKGKFVMADGLDGSGKGVVVGALAEWASQNKLRVFDIRKADEFPEPEDLEDYDVIVSAEPTFFLVGKAIREELVRENNRKYSAMTLAYAFSLDREILYKRVIVPALSAGKHVFQERGMVTSFVYQPVQEHIQLSELLKLPGNRLAMQYCPDLLLILKASPENAVQRLQHRDKKDNSIFDNLAFQRKLADRYGSEWLKALFEKGGSRVAYVDADLSPEDTVNQAVAAWEGLVRKS
ncbi:hypothetical protein HYY74_00905 [Candidatus Woesearchaeota archaeon]|nr:hypothetical protein [Candidatus Woesearchaeota archaeon]